MGARVYIPGIGRFTAVDPIEGGVDNNYVYPTDPVNEYDLTGIVSGIPSMYMTMPMSYQQAQRSSQQIVTGYNQCMSNIYCTIGSFMIPGGSALKGAQAVSKVKMFAPIAVKTKVVPGVAKKLPGGVARVWAKHDPVFGYRRGILNQGPNRIGFSKCGSNICFRKGIAGSHNIKWSIRLPIKWPGYK